MERRRRIPPHVMIVLAAALVSAYAVGNILGNRVEKEQLDACREGVTEAARLLPDKRPTAVALACAPLFHVHVCKDAFATFAADTSTARLGALVRTCRDAYCGRLTPAPDVCSARVPSPDHAVSLFAAIFRKEHGGTDAAADLGRTLATALGAPSD